MIFLNLKQGGGCVIHFRVPSNPSPCEWHEHPSHCIRGKSSSYTQAIFVLALKLLFTKYLTDFSGFITKLALNVHWLLSLLLLVAPIKSLSHYFCTLYASNEYPISTPFYTYPSLFYCWQNNLKAYLNIPIPYDRVLYIERMLSKHLVGG